MNYFKEILTSKSESYSTSNALLCENAHNHLIFKKEKKHTLDTHIKSISIALDEGKCKRTALAHLLVFLPQCPKDVMVIYGHRWIKDCDKILKAKNHISLTPALLTVIRVVLKCCSNNQELLSNVSKLNANYLSQIFSVDNEFREPACLCLFQFLRLFPMQALPYKNSIETMLMSFLHLPLSSSATSTVASAAHCFALLPVPGQTMSINQVKKSRLEQLMALTHRAIDELFKNVRENETYKFTRSHKLPLRTLDSFREIKRNPLERLLTAARITGHCFTFVRGFLEIMAAEVHPRELVRLVLRVLQVNLKLSDKSGAIESTALAFVLPSIHASAIRFLQSLIASHLCEPFGGFVEEQLVATLNATHDMRKRNRHKSNLLVRTLCYETLRQLIQISGGFHAASLKTLIPVLIKDTLPNKTGIELKSATRGARLATWSAKKKSKKKGYTVESDQSSAANNAEEDALPDVTNDYIPTTVAALSLIEALFLHAHHCLTGEIVRTLQEHLWALLALLRRGVFPDFRVRSCLFDVLVALALHPHPLCPPPYVLIHQVLEEGTRDSCISVSEICRKGLATLSFLAANPSVASWANAAWQTGASTIKPTAPKENGIENDSPADKFFPNGDVSKEEDDESEMDDNSLAENSTEDEEEEEYDSVSCTPTLDRSQEDEVEEENDSVLSTPTSDNIVENERVGESDSGSDCEGESESKSANETTEKEIDNIEEDKTVDHHNQNEITGNHNFINDNENSSGLEDISKSDERLQSSDEDQELGLKEHHKLPFQGNASSTEQENKRKNVEDEVTKAKKLKPQKKNKSSSPTLKMMLKTFVDADPDSD